MSDAVYIKMKLLTIVVESMYFKAIMSKLHVQKHIANIMSIDIDQINAKVEEKGHSLYIGGGMFKPLPLPSF